MLPIPGTSSVAQLEVNLKSANLHLSESEWTEVESAVKA
jgi:aryl-alcohol dehydrogenase-like predicted oxidoreductase